MAEPPPRLTPPPGSPGLPASIATATSPPGPCTGAPTRHRIFADEARSSLSDRLAAAPAARPAPLPAPIPLPPSPVGAAAVAGMREAMRQVLTRRAAHREQPGPQHGTPLPRRARSEIQAGPDGWHLRVELPGAPPGTVALWLSGGRLAIAAAGSRPYAARLLLPLEADPASLRWHCEHGLLQAHLAPHRHDAEPAA